MFRCLIIIFILTILHGCYYCEGNKRPDFPDLILSHKRDWIPITPPLASRIQYQDGQKYFPLVAVSADSLPKFFTKADLDSFILNTLKDTTKYDEGIDFSKKFAVVFYLDLGISAEEYRISYWLNTDKKSVECFLEYIFNSCTYDYARNPKPFPRSLFVRYFDLEFKSLNFKLKTQMHGY